MDTSFDIKAWINAIDTYWRKEGIELEDGASELQISEAEQILGIQFPSHFKELYRKVNGFKANDWNEHMVSIWPIERMLEEHSHKRYPNFVGFSDYLVNSHVFGFLKDRSGIYKFYDLADIGMPVKIADSFPQAIDLINANSELLY
ncbi:MAG TPA: SMI1/KNR4 family protein [Chitinophagaceae bacterium]|jgi:hypothetical protein|nr:SMI1/KNR4 family protein [Chitinophagaceae bacterium]